LRDAVAEARPDAVIHQLTDLPKALGPDSAGGPFLANSRLRIEGTANLVAAARAAGAHRLIAQSVAFAYAPGRAPHDESDPLASAEGDTPSAVAARGVRALEAAVLGAGMDGIVLRYGRLYGPGTWNMAPGGPGALHVDAAAHAALLALTARKAGVYNIAEPGGPVAIDKARQELGFDPSFRLPV
jgi:nucleoside-diphosphate-sugar epimerase